MAGRRCAQAIEGAAKKVEPSTARVPCPRDDEGDHDRPRRSRGQVEVWVPTQNAEASLAAATEEAGCRSTRGEVYKLDPAAASARPAAPRNTPARRSPSPSGSPGSREADLTREEDQAHDFYRPISQWQLSAARRRQRQARWPAHSRVRQSIKCVPEPAGIKDGKDLRQLQGLWKEPGDAQFGYHRAELAHRICDAQHARAGRPWRGVNTNQNGVYLECFMDGGGPRGRAGPARVPPRPEWQPSEAPGGPECGGGQGGLGQPLPAACIAASRSSWAMAATRRPSRRCRERQGPGQGFIAW